MFDALNPPRPDTAPAPRLGPVWQVWGAFALLLALMAVPVFSTVLPPLFDYPNHLARMHLLAEGGDRFYRVVWAPLPNLAEDLIVPPLARLMPLATAGELFLVMIFALIAGGVLCLNRVVAGGWRLWPLLAFSLLYNRILLWGFLNYLFGIGVALCGLALWLAFEQRRPWQRELASVPLALACFFSHIAAFGVYALALCGLEIPMAVAELRARAWPALGRRIAVFAPQFVVPAALFLGWRHQADAGRISYAGFARKADLLFSVFDNYDRAFDIVCFALFLALGLWLAASGRLRLAPRLGWAAGLIFAAYLLMPSQIYGGSGADHRLPLALFLLLVAGSAPRWPGRRTAIAIGTAAALLLTLRMAVIERVWRRADQIYCRRPRRNRRLAARCQARRRLCRRRPRRRGAASPSCGDGGGAPRRLCADPLRRSGAAAAGAAPGLGGARRRGPAGIAVGRLCLWRPCGAGASGAGARPIRFRHLRWRP